MAATEQEHYELTLTMEAETATGADIEPTVRQQRTDQLSVLEKRAEFYRTKLAECEGATP